VDKIYNKTEERKLRKGMKLSYLVGLCLTVGFAVGSLVGIGILRLPAWWFEFATVMTFTGSAIYYGWKKYKRR